MPSGNGKLDLLTFSHPPERVVSLVPSMTDTLFTLGVGDRVVGMTDFCQPPAEAAHRLVRVGGTRNPSLPEIRDLEPDLVVANMEENNQEVVESLEREGLAVWLTFPRTTQDVIDLLHAIVNLFRLRNPAFQIATLEMTLDWTKLAVHSPVPFFCPIWTHPPIGSESWLMTFNRDTYASDILQVCGGENVFSQRERRYPLAADISGAEPEDPGTRDTRYPRVTLEEIRAAKPEVILLPDEPFPFRQKHQTDLLDLLKDTPAVERGRVWGVDGRLITWHGTYMAKALTELPRYFNLG